jgi:hypothetical protein
MSPLEQPNHVKDGRGKGSKGEKILYLIEIALHSKHQEKDAHNSSGEGFAARLME